MSNFEKASEVFDTTFNEKYYFDSLNSSYAKATILKTINTGKTPLIFLLGEPGVGKTYMLHLVKKELKESKKILSSSEPFSTAESFLHFLLQEENVSKDLSLSELKDLAVSTFTDIDNLIMIDEAQLLNESVLEYIRVLSDSGVFYFLISMHKEEGELIVKKRHFASRNSHSVILGVLKTDEILQFIKSQLSEDELSDLNTLFSQKQAKQLAKFSKGNFRLIKQLLKHSFSIMDYASKAGHAKFTLPSKCVITMAAIDIGIINA